LVKDRGLEAYRRQAVICLLLLSPLREEATCGGILEVMDHMIGIDDVVRHEPVTECPRLPQLRMRKSEDKAMQGLIHTHLVQLENGGLSLAATLAASIEDKAVHPTHATLAFTSSISSSTSSS
jgi:hypothetical protein